MKKILTTLTLFLLCFTSNLSAQQDTTWAKFNWLVGDWIGEGDGAPGQGSGWFSFHPDLDGNILVRNNHAEYPAMNNKPKTIHDDLMIVYPGYSGQSDKAIYFDNEGHIINYIISYSEKAIVFTSSNVQNMPVFRLTYNSLENETINVKFEMSQAGEKFMTYTEGKCRKKK
jgi:hypothetical protein